MTDPAAKTTNPAPIAIPAPAIPAYAELRTRVPFLWAGRRLPAGTPVIDIRARGGAADLKALMDRWNWSAFQIVPIAGPGAAPAADPAPSADVAALAQRIAELEHELDQRPKSVPVGEAIAQEWKPTRATLIRTLAALTAEDLAGMPGIGPKKAAELLAWATDALPSLPPELPLLDAQEPATELTKA